MHSFTLTGICWGLLWAGASVGQNVLEIMRYCRRYGNNIHSNCVLCTVCTVMRSTVGKCARLIYRSGSLDGALDWKIGVSLSKVVNNDEGESKPKC